MNMIPPEWRARCGGCGWPIYWCWSSEHARANPGRSIGQVCVNCIPKLPVAT